MTIRWRRGVGILVVLIGLCCYCSACAFVLITPAEAHWPDQIFEGPNRDPFPGPQIRINECPEKEFPYPIDLTILLKAWPGTRIIQDTLEINYLKRPEKPLLPVLYKEKVIPEPPAPRTELPEMNIPIKNAEVPFGMEHHIRIRVRDTRDKISTLHFALKVTAGPATPVWFWLLNWPRPRLWFMDPYANCKQASL